jgi:hypothetical protein
MQRLTRCICAAHKYIFVVWRTSSNIVGQKNIELRCIAQLLAHKAGTLRDENG